jgi:sugar phosphate isomerase/epimerase
MSKNDIELMNLFWTHAGVYPLEKEISRYDFKERVKSISRAGFKGISIWHTDLQYNLRKYSLSDLKHIMDDYGIKYIELEFLTNWFVGGTKKEESDRIKRMLFDASRLLEAKHIKVGDFNNTPCPIPRLIDAFGELCSEAAEHGATIAFEFMPSSVIKNLNEALILVEETAVKNGGLILDIAHVMKQGITTEQLNKIPLQYLFNIELNDGTFPGSPLHDPERERRFCGEGEYDIKGFIQWADSLGYLGPWAVEVFSKELLDIPLDDLNQRAYSTTIKQFDS